MAPRAGPLAIAVIAAAALAAAFAGQYLLGWAPCIMCLWQRWPWVAVLGIAGLATVWPAGRRPLLVVAALALAVGAGLAAWHWGVARGWWPGPAQCGATPPAGLDAAALLEHLRAMPVVRCDQPQRIAGLSLPAWNLLGSLATLGLTLKIALASRREPS